MSDQRGRRKLLVGAIVVTTLTSVVCALAPGIGLMMVAHFVQGFAGGWAMVIGRAVVVDLARGCHDRGRTASLARLPRGHASEPASWRLTNSGQV